VKKIIGMKRLAAFAIFSLLIPCCAFAQNTRREAPTEDRADLEPPNSAAEIHVDENTARVSITYNGRKLFEGELLVQTARGEISPSEFIRATGQGNPNDQPPTAGFSWGTMLANGAHDSVEQDFRFRIGRAVAGASLVLRGIAYGSTEAFAAETFSQAQLRFPLIRTTVGPSHNLRNNALYDRRFDWVLYGPGDGATKILPQENSSDAPANAFRMEMSGNLIVLTFKPRFYQRHRNIAFFEPWKYHVWPDSVAGWSSWWAYEENINEKLIHDMADVFAEKLGDYGYKYIQIDAGYQPRQGFPSDWLKTNDKFPGGLASLAAYIREKNLKPALWLNVQIDDEALARAHPDWFVQKNGTPFKAQWVGYGMDGSNPAMIDQLIRPTYRAVHDMGWSYVKVDTLRHLLYDASYPARDYLKSRGATPENAFRNVFGAIREELGRETYLLACWGVLPETVGIADASRLGTDGFGPTTLVQYNSWNNVVWRNDPDHVDIAGDGEDVIRPVMTSMAGAQMLLTDKLEFYRDGSRLEGARRSAPILFSLPGQLYDYDPTKTNNLAAGLRNADGGTYSGPIDADQRGMECPWWMMDISRPFESWTILAHMSWNDLPAATVRFEDLGLRSDRKYLVYEFWSKKFLGEFTGSLAVAAQKAKETRVFAIREELDRPQILSTSRHITQGGVDLKSVKWSSAERRLSGESEVVAGDSYSIVVHTPKGFALATATMNGTAAEISQNGEIATVEYLPQKTGAINWSVQFH
jgi:alpha-galactosidase